MAYDNAQMAQAWGDLLGLTPAQVTTLQADLDQWALGGARLTTWARLATDVNLFNDAAVAMVHDWYGGAANGGPNGDGLYPLMNSDAEVFLLPSPARVVADMASFEPKGTLPSVDDLPTTGEPGDLWVIAGDAWGWNSREGAWKNVGPFRGPPGHAIELQTTVTHVQWRVVGDASWIDLISLADLAGADGKEVSLQSTSTHIQWRLGSSPWTDLIAIADLMGADGREVELQASATHIQWRYVGDAGWTNLVALSVITPTPVPGPAAWTPVIANVVSGERRVQRIVDWIGGEGGKPATGKYLGPSGLVDTAAEATDVRGAGGSGSGDMIAANNLSDLVDKDAARVTLSVYSRAETDDLLDGKQANLGFTPADAASTYTKAEVDAAFDALPEPHEVPAFATVAEVRAGAVDGKIIAPKAAADAQATLVITRADAAIGVNFDSFINAQIVLDANGTLGPPSGGYPGKSGLITLSNATGSASLAFNAAYRMPKGGIVVEAGVNAATRIPYMIGGAGAVILFPASKWSA